MNDFIKNLAKFAYNNANNVYAARIMRVAKTLEENELVVTLVNEWADLYERNQEEIIDTLSAIASHSHPEWATDNYEYATGESWSRVDGFADAVMTAIDAVIPSE